MGHVRYSTEQIEGVLKDFEQTGDVKAVSDRHGIPSHAIYRFRRIRKSAPEKNKDKRIQYLSKEVKKKDLEIRILRELLKKTYQVMPIESPLPKDS